MPSLTAESSPYDVLSPVDTGATDSNTDNQDADVDNVDDADVDDGAEDTDDGEGDGADASDEGDESAEEGDPQAKADADAAAKAEDAQWKAKDGNLPSALKELIAANPNAAKRLKEMYFTNQRLMKFGPAAEIKKMKEAIDTMGGVDKLLEIKSQIDQMGGEAGFQEAQQELGAWRQIDDMWVGGDTNLVNHLASINEASFEKIAPAMFSKLYDVNPELYNNLGAQIIVSTFANDGTIMNFNLMQQALGAGDAKLASQYANKINAALVNLENMSRTAPKQKAADPAKAQWEQERQGFQQKEQERFQTDVQTRNAAWMNPKLNAELGSYLNGAEKKFSQNTLARLDRAVKEEIWEKHLKVNSTFMKSRESLYKKQDVDGIERLYKQYADKLFPTVVRQIAKEFGLAPAAKRQAGVAQSGSNKSGATATPEKGVKWLDKLPRPDEIDQKKTTFDMKMRDEFIMKDGSKAKLRPPKK